MTAFLLSVHVVAAIVLVGPMTVAASLFPRYARAAATASDGASRSGPVAVAAAMHRISRVYAVAALVVPVFGIGTATAMHVMNQTWLRVSILVTVVAAALLVVEVVPGQQRVLGALGERDPVAAVTPAALSRLGVTTGLFALAWVVVVVLMIVRPGSTTGIR